MHNIPDLCLSYTKIVFFPKNTTNCLQPLDAGVIQAFKMNYRRHLHSLILNRMTDEATATEDPYKSVNIALVIVWVFRAWRDLNPRTISKCFARCGFQFQGDTPENVENTPMGTYDEDAQLIVAEMDEKNLFPPPVEPENLWNRKPMERKLILNLSPSSLHRRMLWMPFKLCRCIHWDGGWEDGSVLGSTIDLGWYQGIVQSSKDQEKYQTKISDFFRTGDN